MRFIRKVAYVLDLPNNLAGVHPVFNLFLLKTRVEDPTYIVPLEILV